MSVEPGGIPLRLRRDLTVRIEPRGFILLAISVFTYTISAFVGNEWCYLIPASILAVVLIGVLLPIIEVLTIDAEFSVVCSAVNPQIPELLVSLQRKPEFKLLSTIVPSGYLNARLLLQRRTWNSPSLTPTVVPIPALIESLNHGFDTRLKMPELKRGVYELQHVQISSCFPFAITWCSRLAQPSNNDTNREITVYPQLVPVSGNFHTRLSESEGASGRQLQRWIRPNQSLNFKGLREFTERDSLTHIHWSSTARTGKLLVREFEVESMPHFDVVLDLTANWQEDQFELAVTTAYSLLRYAQWQGFTAELYLVPAASSTALADLLADCPIGLTGEDFAAELLSRVSPLSAGARSHIYDEAEESARHMTTCALNGHRNLVGIQPQKSGSRHTIAIVEYIRAVNTSNTARDPSQLLAVCKALAQLETETELARL